MRLNLNGFRFGLLSLVLATLAAALYGPGLPGGFILDDGINILRNHILYVERFDVEQFIYAALRFHDGNGSRALPMLSFAIDHWRAGGMHAAAFKTTNIVIHGVTVLAVAFFLRRVLLIARWPQPRACWGALVLALAWAAHPLQVSSVLYVVQRMQTLATLFIVLALWAYVAMRQAQQAGGRGRLQGVAVVLAWLLALACKEDAVLLPAYTLALELTVLRFDAAQPKVARGLRQSYALMVAAGLALFVLYALPRYWHWEAYPGRDFSSPERLLTQARVLVMYLGQILLPWPDAMPFNYDGYPVSRSLWQPWTTLPALLLLLGLLAWAWAWRRQRPLFALGVLLFFAGHFISSNIIALELVFEHRNHWPLLGVVLAVGDLLALAAQRLRLGPTARHGVLAVLLLTLAGATLARAHVWGDPLRLGEKLVALSPQSTRSWVELGSAWFSLYQQTQEPAHLQRAIDVSEQSFEHVGSVAIAGNVVLFKSMQNTLTDADWQRFYSRLRQSASGPQPRQFIQMLMRNARNGFIQDQAGLVGAMQTYVEVSDPGFQETMEMGVYAYRADRHEDALALFRRAARLAKPDEPVMDRLIDDLTQAGRGDWASELRALQSPGS